MDVPTYADQLDTAKEQLAALLESPIEEYRTVEGGGGQQFRNRKIEELQKLIDWLEKKVAQTTRPRVFQAVRRFPYGY